MSLKNCLWWQYIEIGAVYGEQPSTARICAAAAVYWAACAAVSWLGTFAFNELMNALNWLQADVRLPLAISFEAAFNGASRLFCGGLGSAPITVVRSPSWPDASFTVTACVLAMELPAPSVAV